MRGPFLLSPDHVSFRSSSMSSRSLLLFVLGFGGVRGCSFLFSTWPKIDTSTLAHANVFMQRRGPDATQHVTRKGYTFVHNLLHMTGDRVLQPLGYLDEQVQILFNGEIYNWAELEARYCEGGKKQQKPRDDDAGMLAAGGGVSESSEESCWETNLRKGETLGEGGTDHFASDGDAIFPAYAEWGDKFASVLDGEFAIVLVDFRKNLVLLATDVFGTKPLWYSTDRGFHAATYESALERLGLKNRVQAPPNSVLKFDLTTKILLGTIDWDGNGGANLRNDGFSSLYVCLHHGRY